MAEKLYRVSHADLEVRSDGDGRTVAGIAVPYDDPVEIRTGLSTFTEVFRRGAFAKTISERGPAKVKFLLSHDTRKLPLGRAVELREDAAGLFAEFRVSKTTEGDDALESIRDGALDALSIGFEPVKDRWNKTRDFVERLEAKLFEVSATPFPAYENAAIVGVRADGSPFGLARSAAQARIRLLEVTQS